MDGKVNILLVDYKPEKLLALEAVLEDLQQNVVRAYSGERRYETLSNHFSLAGLAGAGRLL